MSGKRKGPWAELRAAMESKSEPPSDAASSSEESEESVAETPVASPKGTKKARTELVISRETKETLEIVGQLQRLLPRDLEVMRVHWREIDAQEPFPCEGAAGSDELQYTTGIKMALKELEGVEGNLTGRAGAGRRILKTIQTEFWKWRRYQNIANELGLRYPYIHGTDPRCNTVSRSASTMPDMKQRSRGDITQESVLFIRDRISRLESSIMLLLQRQEQILKFINEK